MSPCPRRSFLAATLRAGLVVGCGPLLAAGCGPRGESAAPDSLRLALAALPDGARVRHEIGGRPVEIRREGDEVIALSLLCTHQGCEVAWHQDEGAYVCPCHDGRFGPDGTPLYGPPPMPLRRIDVTRDGDDVVIGA